MDSDSLFRALISSEVAALVAQVVIEHLVGDDVGADTLARVSNVASKVILSIRIAAIVTYLNEASVCATSSNGVPDLDIGAVVWSVVRA